MARKKKAEAPPPPAAVETVTVTVLHAFTGPDAPAAKNGGPGARPGDTLTVSPDRADLLCDTYRVATRS